MAEEFAFEEVIGDGGAVDDDIGPFAAGAGVVEHARGDFLAGAGFAENQHRQGPGGRAGDDLADALD